MLRDPPRASAGEDKETLEMLERAFASYRLEMAGPLIPFDGKTALAAAKLIHHACWFLVSHAEPESDLDKTLVMPGPPQAPAQHLSADLVLRFLPQVYQRARAHDPADRLPALLATVLRQWPLTGVLANMEEGPLNFLEFDGHPGLLQLYAERLAKHPKSAWVPECIGLAYAELVWKELGKELTLLRAHQPAEVRENG